MNIYTVLKKEELLKLLNEQKNLIDMRLKREKKLIKSLEENPSDVFLKFLLKESKKLRNEYDEKYILIYEALQDKKKPKKNVTLKLKEDTIKILKVLSENKKVSQSNIVESLINSQS